MRILHVNKKYGFEGGIEQYLHAVSLALAARGHEVHFLCGERDARAGFIAEERVRVMPELLDRPFTPQPGLQARLERAAREIAPDVIYLHHLQGPTLVEPLARVAPVARYAHMEDVVCPLIEKNFPRDWSPCEYKSGPLTCGVLCPYVHRHGSRHPLRILERLELQRGLREANEAVDHWVVASRFMRRSLEREGIPASRIDLIPYYTTLPPQAPPAPPAARRLHFSGRLVETKGVQFLLQAMTLLPPDVTLDVVGEGPYRKPLEELAARLGVSARVRFAGWVANEGIRSYREAANVVVVPSVFQEPFGIVGIEAMAQARPVVAHRVGGIPQWLSDGETGYAVASTDARAMAARIRELLDDPALARRMGERGRDKVAAEFVEERHLPRLEELFERLAKDSKGARDGRA